MKILIKLWLNGFCQISRLRCKNVFDKNVRQKVFDENVIDEKAITVMYVGDGCGDVCVVCMRLSCESFEDEKRGRFTTTTTFSPINLVNMQNISSDCYVTAT